MRIVGFESGNGLCLGVVLTLEARRHHLHRHASGVGHARKADPVWMRNGDECEIEIEGVGTLRNPIADES